MKRQLYVFAKAPRAGAVKTRLAAGVGAGRAAAIFRALTEHTIREARKGPWETTIAVDPASAMRGWMTLWPPALRRQPQGSGDLGARMKRVFDAAPRGPVVIVGADAPGLRARHVRAAFAALAGADAAFGPADDGGYWLIGLARRRAAPRLFQNVRWSSARALYDTIVSLPTSFEIAMLEPLGDIDEAGDLAKMNTFSTAR